MRPYAAFPLDRESLADAQAQDDPFLACLGMGAASDDLWLDKPAPRYTSYPPATSFQDVAPATYAETLERLSPQEAVSLYLHVPFCQGLCLYCGCHTSVTSREDRLSDYVAALEAEIGLLAATSASPRRVSHIHFGGGSPNFLSPAVLTRLFKTLSKNFALSYCDETALELDPRLVTAAQARLLVSLGANRVSLGVQDFNPEVQAVVHRQQPFDFIARVMDDLRSAGMKAINFDLMYGLPLQTPSSISKTARQAVSLGPDRIALFSYAHVPQIKPHQKALEAYPLPGGHTRLAMENAAREVLLDEGYVAIGMDHFARPDDPLAIAMREGRLRRNFQGYTDDASPTILGLGASSIGCMKDGFFQNEKDVGAYEKIVSEGTLATKRGLLIDGIDRLRASIIERLMCDMACDTEAVCRAHNVAVSTILPDLEALARFEAAGLIRRRGYKIALASPHRMAIRVIAQIFDHAARASGTIASRTA